MSALDNQSATELFQNYQSDFQLVYTDLTQKIQELPSLSSGKWPRLRLYPTAYFLIPLLLFTRYWHYLSRPEAKGQRGFWASYWGELWTSTCYFSC